MPEQTSPKSLRRRLRLSVRVLMVLVFILGGVPGWILSRARVQREAVAAIKRAGGSVGYDSEWSNPTPPAGSPSSRSPWSPKWLVDCVGTDLLLNAVSVHLPRGTSDLELVYAGCLTRLESLVVHPSTVTDAGLVHLRELTSLSNLQIPGSKVGGEGLAHLEGMINLQMLILWDSEVTDAGLVHLKGLTSLRTLDLSNTKVTDAGMINLKGLNNLKGLSLADTRVSDAGLAHLKGLTKLKTLLITGVEVTDSSVQELNKAMPMLKVVR
jgi:hypothetical protein